MENLKYYFETVDDNHCQPLEVFVNDAKIQGLSEITLIEAIPDKNTGFVWCTYNGEAVDQSECRKSQCSYYEANKSGRGTCIHRSRTIYGYGEEVKFNLKPHDTEI